MKQREKRGPKRSKVDLYASVLEVIKRYPEGVRITKMSYGVGAPLDRLKSILRDLNSFGLVQTLSGEDAGASEDGVFYCLTPRAFEFLETYWKMKGFLEAFEASGRSDF